MRPSHSFLRRPGDCAAGPGSWARVGRNAVPLPTGTAFSHSLVSSTHPRAAALTSGALLCWLQGIPVAFPGGVLAEDALDFLEATLAWGGKVTGAADPSCQTLQVVARGVLLEEGGDQ